VRPYAAKTAGVPLRFEYEMATGAFTYSWAIPTSDTGSTSAGEVEYDGAKDRLPSVQSPPLTGHPPLVARETEIFVPKQLVRGRRLIVEGLARGDTYTYDAARQTLFILLLPAAEQGSRAQTRTVHVRFDPPVRGELPNDFWSDFGSPVGAVVVALLALVAYYCVVEW